MATAKTDYHEAQVTDRIFDNSAPDGAVDGVHVALWTSSPANDPDESNEVSGDGYSAQKVPASGWSLTNNNQNPREYENDSDVDFGVLDSGSQTTVAGVVLFDGPDTAADNALYRGDLEESRTVDADDEFRINAGDITISEN